MFSKLVHVASTDCWYWWSIPSGMSTIMIMFLFFTYALQLEKSNEKAATLFKEFQLELKLQEKQKDANRQACIALVSVLDIPNTNPNYPFTSTIDSCNN